MSGLIQSEVVAPEQMGASYMVPAAQEFTGCGCPFDLRWENGWEFVEAGKLDYTTDPSPGARRTWRVDQIHSEGEWLADVSEIRYNPGANGVTESGTGKDAKIRPMTHINGLTMRGAVVIVNGMNPAMGPYRNFRARFPYEGGGWFYCFAGVSLRPLHSSGLGARARAVPETDHGWVVGMRRQLVSAGIIPAMDRYVLDNHLKVSRARLATWSQMLARGDLSADAFARKEREENERMGRMRKAFERQFGEIVDTAAPPILAPLDTGDDLDTGGLLPAEPPPKRGR